MRCVVSTEDGGSSVTVCVSSWLSLMACGLTGLEGGACGMEDGCDLRSGCVGDGEGLMLLPLAMSECLGWMVMVAVVVVDCDDGGGSGCM